MADSTSHLSQASKYNITLWKYGAYGSTAQFEHCTEVQIMDLRWVHFKDKDGFSVKTNVPVVIIEEKPA